MKKIAMTAMTAALLLSAQLFAQPLATDAAAEDAVCFVVREHNGRIALFSESGSEPLAVYKTPLTSLFPGDIELLREGIRLKSRAEVTRLIADLGLE